MFTRTSPQASNRAVALQCVRGIKRKPAYPAYKAEVVPLSHPKKDHSSYFRRHLEAWLGPRNIRGEYYRNKYYFPPQDHKPNYVVPDGNAVVVPGKEETRFRQDGKRNPALHPFPQNTHCKTASVISDDLKSQIFTDVTEGGILTQELAHKYGIKLSRVEAIVKLQQVERNWREKVCF